MDLTYSLATEKVERCQVVPVFVVVVFVVVAVVVVVRPLLVGTGVREQECGCGSSLRIVRECSTLFFRVCRDDGRRVRTICDMLRQVGGCSCERLVLGSAAQ